MGTTHFISNFTISVISLSHYYYLHANCSQSEQLCGLGHITRFPPKNSSPIIIGDINVGSFFY